MVEIHAEGGLQHLQHFSAALLSEAPHLSAPGPLAIAACEPENAKSFAILDSTVSGHADIHLPPDGFVCADCLRSEEHTSELQSLMRISYAVFCLKNKKT